MNRSTEEALRVLELEAQSLRTLAEDLRDDPLRQAAFADAVALVTRTHGHVIIVGVGKSGHIGLKIAASFASTGTPAFFMHPTEASHGDLGMVTRDCTVVAISNSGESRELADVLHYCTKAGVPVIALTRQPDSMLGRAASVVLQLPETEEACINGLAPTTSTTNTLALGDALVVAVMAEKGVSRDDFGRHHPGGKLGRGLQTVADWRATHPAEPPTVGADAGMQEVVGAVSAGLSGCVAVVDAHGDFLGMITDGDLRRAMTPDMFSKTASDIMTTEPFTPDDAMTMRSVIDVLTARKIGNAFVVENGKPVAVLNMKTLMTQGYV